VGRRKSGARISDTESQGRGTIELTYLRNADARSFSVFEVRSGLSRREEKSANKTNEADVAANTPYTKARRLLVDMVFEKF
jgi:hypothetical protein